MTNNNSGQPALPEQNGAEKQKCGSPKEGMGDPIEALARRLFEKARPGQTCEWPASFVQRAFGHAIVIVPTVLPNVRDADGREFGLGQVGALISVIDPRGNVFEGHDPSAKAGGGHWDTSWMEYQISEILRREQKLVLIGHRIEFRQHWFANPTSVDRLYETIVVGKQRFEVELGSA